MREISINLNLKGISKKVKQYLKNIPGGYFFEIFLASNRIVSKPFKIVNGKKKKIFHYKKIINK
jgi:hypothetical protein